MKIVLDFTVHCTDPSNRHVLGGFRKTIESNLIPVPGMEINDSAWSDSKKIVDTTLIFADEEYYVTLERVNLEKKEHYEQNAKTFKMHGWKDLGER